MHTITRSSMVSLEAAASNFLLLEQRAQGLLIVSLACACSLPSDWWAPKLISSATVSMGFGSLVTDPSESDLTFGDLCWMTGVAPVNELAKLSNPAAKVLKKPFSAVAAAGKVRVSSCCGVEKTDAVADSLLDDVTLVSDCTSLAGVITTLDVAVCSLDSVTWTRTAA